MWGNIGFGDILRKPQKKDKGGMQENRNGFSKIDCKLAHIFQYPGAN